MVAVQNIASIASGALEQERQIREAAVVSNERLVAMRLAARKERLRHTVRHQGDMNKRLARAVRGVDALSSACTTPEIQALISMKSSLGLWGARLRLGGEGGPVEYFFGMKLLPEGILIYDQTMYGDNPPDKGESMMFFLPYGGDSFIRHLRLAHIVTARGCNPARETKRFESLDGNYEDPTSILFQILADCADPRKLHRYLLRTMKY